MAPNPNPIQHVVVVMLENRSYDNVLGWLYGQGNASPYDTPPAGQADLDGLTDSSGASLGFSNEDASGNVYTVANAPAATVWGTSYPGTTIPAVDPGEQFGDMAQQFLGTSAVPTATPYATPPYSPGAQNLMSGFVLNYAAFAAAGHGNLQDVMNYLTPAQLPVTAFLANQFAVCDQWFASAPTQTFTNRVFALCAAPGIVSASSDYSLIDDKDYPFNVITLTPDSSSIALASICKQLDTILGASGESGPYWKVYFHDYSIAVLTDPYVAAQAQTAGTQNVATFDFSDWGNPANPPGAPFAFKKPPQLVDPGKGTWATTFVEDVTNNALPPFSFIEPRYSVGLAPGNLPTNSNHPGTSAYLPGNPVGWGTPPNDAAGGELLLMQVYNLLQANGYLASTLLIVTYDEHGGVYDHVPPPLAPPPGTVNTTTPPSLIPPANSFPVLGEPDDPAVTNFGYTLFGGRVPAIIVSQNIQPGTTIRAEDRFFDHASIVKTVWDLFNLSSSPSPVACLTARDASAPSLGAFVDASANNTPGAFSGTLLTNPTALFLYGSTDSISVSGFVLASAGPGYTLTYSTSGNIAGLSVNQTAGDPGTNLAVFEVIVSNPNKLSAGVFTGTLKLTATGATTLTQNVPITVNIIKAL